MHFGFQAFLPMSYQLLLLFLLPRGHASSDKMFIRKRYCSHSSSQISRRRGGPISKHISGLGTNKNMAMGPDGTRNQECLYWRRPATNYYSATVVSGAGITHGIANRLQVGRPKSWSSISGRDKRFISTSQHPDRLWGPLSLLYRGSFPGVKRPGLESDHSPPSCAEVKNVRSSTRLHGVVLN
jgi:hypothetical protein